MVQKRTLPKANLITNKYSSASLQFVILRNQDLNVKWYRRHEHHHGKQRFVGRARAHGHAEIHAAEFASTRTQGKEVGLKYRGFELRDNAADLQTLEETKRSI